MSALDIWRRYYESLARSRGSLLARDKNLKYLVEREIKLNCASQGPLHICQSAKFRESTHQSLIWTFRLMHQTSSARQPTTSILADAPTRIDSFKWTPERIVLSMRTSDAMGGRDMPCQSPSSPPPGDARQVRKKRVGCTATRLSPTGSYRTYKLGGPRKLKSDQGEDRSGLFISLRK